jgi:hypothetical protein
MVDHLEIHNLIRLGDAQKQARKSIDFVVNGASLFVLTEANDRDMCGRFSSGTREQNIVAAEVFMLRKAPDLESGRSLLFVCPECGDIGCGAIAIRISQQAGSILWFDFAYENSYEESRPVSVGPFRFEAEAYAQVIAEASHT